MTNDPYLLLVEDDVNFGSVLKSYLELNDFKVDWVSDGKDANEKFIQGNYQMILLDVMLPNLDGFSIAKQIKASGRNIPFIFITAKTLREDVVAGYKTGADDYITKPFDSEILLYKIKAVLSRHQNKHETGSLTGILTLGHFLFDYRSRKLTNQQNNHSTSLTPKESELLYLLIMQQGELLSKVVALNKIWGDANYFTTRSMDVYITKLRKHLSSDASIQIITIHGDGYRLVTEGK